VIVFIERSPEAIRTCGGRRRVVPCTDHRGDKQMSNKTLTKLVVGAFLTATPMSVIAAQASAAPAKLTQAQAASQLRGAGITWSSSGRCTNRNNGRCTSFAQINASTVAGVISFKRASGCATNITGGTEVGHQAGTFSHANGYKVDIAPTTCNTNYIKAHFTHIANRKVDNAPQYKSPAGNVYARESNHWDIRYVNANA
jgi:hypothetical protein